MLLGGFIAGMLWALVPALMKVKLAIDEVVTTLLLNTVILFVVSYLLNGPWRDPVSGWPQSPQIAASTIFPKLLPRSRLHLGFLIGILAIFLLWFIFSRTTFGLKMRASGLGKEAASFAGVKVGRTVLIAALISGGIAGMAGVSEVAGIHFHLIDAISPGYGYTGIIIAMLGALHPLGWGGRPLYRPAEYRIPNGKPGIGCSRLSGEVVQATLLLVTLGAFVLQNYRLRRVSTSPPPDGDPRMVPGSDTQNGS